MTATATAAATVCSRKTIAAAVSHAKSILTSKINARVRVRTSDGEIHIEAGNGNQWADERIPAMESAPLDVVVSHDALTKALKATVASQFVGLGVSGSILHVTAGSVDASIDVLPQTIPRPSIPSQLSMLQGTFDVPRFVTALEAVLPVVKDAPEEAQSSILFEGGRLVATNGTALCWYDVEDATSPEGSWTLLPSRAAASLLQYAKGKTGELIIACSGGQIAVDLPAVSLIFMADHDPQEFPAYRHVLPALEAIPLRWFEVDRTLFLCAIESASVFSNVDARVIDLRVERGRILIDCLRTTQEILHDEIEILKADWIGEVRISAPLALSAWKAGPDVLRIEQFGNGLAPLVARSPLWGGIVTSRRKN